MKKEKNNTNKNIIEILYDIDINEIEKNKNIHTKAFTKSFKCRRLICLYKSLFENSSFLNEISYKNI